MKKLLAALCVVALPFAFWLGNWGSAEAQVTGPIACGAYGAAFPSSATTTIVVNRAATGSARILICGFDVQATGGTAQLVYGTGSNCATNQVALSPIYLAGVVGTDQSSQFRGLAVPPGNDVCVVTGASTTAAQAFVFYGLQ